MPSVNECSIKRIILMLNTEGEGSSTSPLTTSKINEGRRRRKWFCIRNLTLFGWQIICSVKFPHFRWKEDVFFSLMFLPPNEKPFIASKFADRDSNRQTFSLLVSSSTHLTKTSQPTGIREGDDQRTPTRREFITSRDQIHTTRDYKSFLEKPFGISS